MKDDDVENTKNFGAIMSTVMTEESTDKAHGRPNAI
jgi:hypothetical protein